MRTPLALLSACVLALGLATAAQGQGGTPVPGAGVIDNPCLGLDAAELLCPNLRMQPPSDLMVSKTRSGRRLLHATNSIDSRGEGPAELRGKRYGKHYMEANQRILLRGGGRRTVETPARLGFKNIPGQGGYWKYKDAGRFELWTLDENDNPVERVRTGPKQYYCLRDLVRTQPMAGSPRGRVYPACNQNRHANAVTLGTSVGWSDVYPSTYHEQYIEITGLTGRYGFIHVADPGNGIWENDEDDNAAMTIVSLPSGKRLGSRGPMPRP
ncbi:MAG TPA: hypothetical protein VF517_18520 [Thermoleophilaceae bacterium]